MCRAVKTTKRYRIRQVFMEIFGGMVQGNLVIRKCVLRGGVEENLLCHASVYAHGHPKKMLSAKLTGARRASR